MAPPRLVVALRPALPADAPTLADIFRASIEGLTGEDYDEEQQAAWMEAADDEAEFAERLARHLTIVATVSGAPVGFAALREPGHLDMLYVHPGVARRGVGTALAQAIEALARARGATTLTVDASDTARPFFAARGYEARHRQTVALGDEWLGNTRMDKRFLADGHA